MCDGVSICPPAPPHLDSLPHGSIQPPPHLSPEAHPHPLCYWGNVLCYMLRTHCLVWYCTLTPLQSDYEGWDVGREGLETPFELQNIEYTVATLYTAVKAISLLLV